MNADRFSRALRALAVLALLPGAAPAEKTSLSIGLVLEPPVLDPTINPADPIRSITNGNVFEGLTWIGEDGQVQPRLATGVERRAGWADLQLSSARRGALSRRHQIRLCHRAVFL